MKEPEKVTIELSYVESIMLRSMLGREITLADPKFNEKYALSQKIRDTIIEHYQEYDKYLDDVATSAAEKF